jgi:hypothetical protein
MAASRADLDLSELRAHVARDHPEIGHPAQDDLELSGQHARAHALRYVSHVHDTPVAELAIGPLAVIEPEGWHTGRNALPRELWLATLRERAAGARAADQPESPMS